MSIAPVVLLFYRFDYFAYTLDEICPKISPALVLIVLAGRFCFMPED
jgi:hypothetical protein